MAHRSSTKRLFVLTPAALGCVALIPLVLAGCQSNAQQDLIARELRMQEDQLYAMEEYLSQYQQLVCKYRSENAALRRRLAEGYYNGEEVPAPQTKPPTTPPGPALGTPPARSRDTTQPPPRANGLELPDVPPLEGDASNGTDLKFKPSGVARKKPSEPAIITASHEEVATPSKPVSNGEAASAAGQSLNDPPPATAETTKPRIVIQPARNDQASPQQVSLHGEVVANDAGGGPRLAVAVEPLDALGRGTKFDGQVSLMLLATSGDGNPQSLARWDYAAEAARAAIDADDGEHTMRFYLELPPDTPVGEATEMWVRLLPQDGSKMLTRAPIHLDQPGSFASHVQGHVAKSVPARIASNVVEGNWTTARPGEPANLPSANDDSISEWRASSELTSTVVQAVATAAPSTIEPAVHIQPTTQTIPPVYKAPTWTPERPGTAAAQNENRAQQSAVATRPTWSASR